MADTSSKPNKAGADWLIIKAKLHTMINDIQEDMLSMLTPEEYHRSRGGILLAREVIEWVEPTTPPQTMEDDYGMLDPSSEKYT